MLKIHKYVTIRQHISDQLMNQRINQNENKKVYWDKKTVKTQHTKIHMMEQNQF